MTKMKRCFPTKGHDPIYEEYHDYEWGKLNLDEKYLYEMLVLEIFQSGLSWSTVLHKRANFKHDFANWDFEKVAQFKEEDYQHLLNDASIIRNKLKIKAAINNAQTLIKLERKYQSFAAFLKKFIPEPIIHHPTSLSEIPSQDKYSLEIATALKKEGFTFVGPVTVYSFLQAVGLINDHVEGCPFKYENKKVSGKKHERV